MGVCQSKQGDHAYDFKNKKFSAEGNYSKAFNVTRLHDKLECVAKVLKPTIDGMDGESKA